VIVAEACEFKEVSGDAREREAEEEGFERR